jgi:hypothetical protein
LDDTDEEDNVYPLSIKYDKRRVCKQMIYRYWFLVIILIFLVPTDLYTFGIDQKLKYRIGYFADKLSEEDLAISGVTEFKFNIQNCQTYLKENSDTSNIKVKVSADRSTTIDYPKSGTIQTTNIEGNDGWVQWYVELYVPGGVTIPKITFTYNGDSAPDIILNDNEDGAFTTPMIVTAFDLIVADSYPNVELTSEHTIGTLTVTGSYWICSFNNVKIGALTFNIGVGSLYLVQNAIYPENTLDLYSSEGMAWVYANQITVTGETNTPTQATRDAGYTSTYVKTDTTAYTRLQYTVCSNACPGIGTIPALAITLNDGPIVLTIKDSATTTTKSYLPTFDDFAITSSIKLTENKNDFSTDSYDPRIYIYEIVSPDYKKMWVHSSKMQYIEARPWLLSLLSVSILKPKYLRGTLIHVPSQCPLTTSGDVKQNTLVYDKLWGKVYTEDTHLIGQKSNNTYYKFELTAKGDYIQTEIPFLNNNIFIILCLAVSLLLGLYSVIAMFLILIRLKWKLEEKMDKYLDQRRKFAKAKKEIQYKNDETKKKTVTVKTNKRIVKILKMNMFTTSIKKKRIDLTEEDEEEIKVEQKMK